MIFALVYTLELTPLSLVFLTPTPPLYFVVVELIKSCCSEPAATPTTRDTLASDRRERDTLLNIVHVFQHLGAGGDWKFVADMARWQVDQGHRVTVCACNAPDDSSRPYELCRLPFDQGARGFYCAVRQARSTFADTDIWHAHAPRMGLFAELMCWATKAKSVLTWHLMPPMSRRQCWQRRLSLAWVDRIVSVSAELHDELIQRVGIPPGQLQKIHYGIDPKGFYPSSKEQRQQDRLQAGYDDNHRVVGFLGRFDEEKDLSLLIDGIARVKDDFPNLRLQLAGNGPLRDQLVQQVENRNLTPRVRWAGYIKDPRAFVSMCDLIVLPSKSHETFGLAIVEAFLCEVPALRSNTPGSSEQILPGQTGEVFQKTDLEDFERVFRKMLEYQDRWPTMGQFAREFALENFQAGQSFQQYLKLYENLLGSTCSSTPVA